MSMPLVVRHRITPIGADIVVIHSDNMGYQASLHKYEISPYGEAVLYGVVDYVTEVEAVEAWNDLDL